ncbi:MAG: hypothetical protein ALECFALPRED_002740 [Alectoria fallacina]|uniref:Uncharacterized protein n=1 Tax=Alectoria fallacina TaxID=1903189 RepID=A0A8H3IDU5_9LECA|nr:MAG: hypothetical protein ALECFALPRED_002740 [Alectoria fallacina]
MFSTSPEVKTSRGVYEGYVNLGTLESGSAVAAKPLKTFVHHGNVENPRHDGIHLTYEMQQISALPSMRDGE